MEEGEFMAAIIGPRRAGKTTLMLQLMDGLAVDRDLNAAMNLADCAAHVTASSAGGVCLMQDRRYASTVPAGEAGGVDSSWLKRPQNSERCMTPEKAGATSQTGC
ncbi:MAG: hypothetical protein JRN24_03570 [Nitrososphaerota archaeon]|nr:hypothetical protein [Nitrososphaerota archaeon]